MKMSESTLLYGTLSKLICILIFAGSMQGQLVTSAADDGSDGTLRQEIEDTPAGGEITFAPTIMSITLTAELVIGF